MFCNKCGNFVPDGTAFCSKCGNAMPVQAQPFNPVPPVPQPYIPSQITEPAKGLASASLVMGILSLCVMPGIASFLGILFGIIAKAKGNRSGAATAGIVCSIISIVLYIILIVFFGGIFLSMLNEV